MKLFRTTQAWVFRCYPDIGERVPVIGCYSEVMCHFRLAGKPTWVSLERSQYMNGEAVEPMYLVGQVWQWQPDRKELGEFSFPITTGEAGFFNDGAHWYTYVDSVRLNDEQLESIRPHAEEDAYLKSA